MALLLLRLARMTDRADFRAAAEHTLRAFASRMEEAGTGVPQMLVAHSFALGRPQEIVLAGPRDDPAMLEMLACDPPALPARRRGDARRASPHCRCRRSTAPPPLTSARISRANCR